MNFLPIDINEILKKHKRNKDSLESTLTQSGSIVNSKDVADLDDIYDVEEKVKFRGAEGGTILVVPSTKHKSRHKHKPAPFDRNALGKILEKPEDESDNTSVRRKDKSTVPLLKIEPTAVSVTLDDVLKSGKARKNPASSSVGGVIGRQSKDNNDLTNNISCKPEDNNDSTNNTSSKPEDDICPMLLLSYQALPEIERTEWLAAKERRLLWEIEKEDSELLSDPDRKIIAETKNDRDKTLRSLKLLQINQLSFRSIFEREEEREREREEERKKEREKEKEKEKIFSKNDIEKLSKSTEVAFSKMEYRLKYLLASGKNQLEARKDEEYNLFKKKYLCLSKELEKVKKSLKKSKN